jgi:predicted O-methyltransferase YrrM
MEIQSGPVTYNFVGIQQSNKITPPVNQAAPWRVEGMKQVIAEFDKPINALEIGAWYGEGSTRIWLEALHETSSITIIDYWKPYCTEKDYQDNMFDYKKMDEMTHDAYINTINVVREYEAKKDVDVTLIRGSSKTYLKNFNDEIFDFIYIDGAHHYDAVKSDIVQAKRLIKKDFGIICGDDYENDPTEEMLELARANKDVDFLKHPGVNHFHPGPLLAIYEEFKGEVNRHDGFWWVYVRDGKFTKEK